MTMILKGIPHNLLTCIHGPEVAYNSPERCRERGGHTGEGIIFPVCLERLPGGRGKMDGASFPWLSASDLPALKVSQLRVGRDGMGWGVWGVMCGERTIRGLCSDRVERPELHGNIER